MRKIIPARLVPGDEIRIIAPSRSLGLISPDVQHVANKRFKDLGLKVSFGKHVHERDIFDSSTIQSRIPDLHEAFLDKKVKAILTVIGGYNSNQLLRYIDWDIIRANPKILCGFSDVTVLNNAIFAKTGLVSYSGPHYSTFGQELYFDYTLTYFKKCLFSKEPYLIGAGDYWTDDCWFQDQQARNLIKNDGYLLVNQGIATGVLLGGNLCTFNLLQGTEYLPDLRNSILFLEDDALAERYSAVEFDRNLQSLIHLPTFGGVRGLVIGRFQKASAMTNDIITKIVKTKRELDHIPIVAHVDFGHTDPKITFPIGGEVCLEVANDHSSITILEH
jgi:muramoyltetrapeptide carboxypeptidase LdcA involved in peptidoglycan recycling